MATPSREVELVPVSETRWRDHLFLSAVAIFILGPLGGIAAAYMNFKIGFFVGGQVLAGILGSAVTLRYGSERGKHYANYMQTMAASVASMCGMAVLIQAISWLGMAQPAWWELSLFFLCVGMFSIGVGMFYTPILVDTLKLPFPSGLAVANILRVLTNKALIKSALAGLERSTFVAITASALGLPYDFSASTMGAGMVVAWRIAVPALILGLIGWELTPMLREMQWLGEKDSFRKVAFLGALGMIIAAAVVDLIGIGFNAFQRLTGKIKVADEGAKVEAHKINYLRLSAWVVFWAAALVYVAWQIFDIAPLYTLVAIGLALVLLMVNGISTGIADANNISVAFVVGVAVLALVGLQNPMVAILAGGILLISSATGVDMLQDRSTGWRLGTNRTMQFRYQWIGVFMGAILAVVLGNFFMHAHPELLINQHHMDNLPEATQKAVGEWQSAMTFKLVGIVESMGGLKPYQLKALLIGAVLGLFLQLVRKLLLGSKGYKSRIEKLKADKDSRKKAKGWALDVLFDVFIFASPYALSFGGFVELSTVVWFAVGGVVASLYTSYEKRRGKQQIAGAEGVEVPEDMSTTSLVGGGFIAGESIWFLLQGLKMLLL